MAGAPHSDRRRSFSSEKSTKIRGFFALAAG